MVLWLEIQYLGNAEAPRNEEVRVATESFLIGRRSDCQLRLADRDKLISSTHASISRSVKGYCITDTSTNGTLLNGTRLTKETLHLLREGDELRIGDYRLLVSRIEDDGDVIESLESAVDPFGMLLSATDRKNPSAEDAVSLDPESLFEKNEKPADIMGLLEDAHPSAAAKGDLVWDDLPPPGPSEDRGGPLEELIEPPRFTSDPDLPSTEPDDPFADWLENMPSDPPLSVDDAESEDPFVPLPAAPEPRSLSPQPSQEPVDRLLDALLEGLGLDRHTPLDPHTAKAMGCSLRVLLQGAMELMRARDEFKNSMRLNRTMIQAKDNNPYKVAVDAEDLIDQLFINPRRGFLSADDASKATMADLGQHETAVIGGLRAMGGELAQKIHPEKLAREFAQKQKFSKIGTLQKAQYWDAFVAYFESEMVDGDPLTDLFAKVYDEVIVELQRSRR